VPSQASPPSVTSFPSGRLLSLFFQAGIKTDPAARVQPEFCR
jgi:hypothetical protein